MPFVNDTRATKKAPVKSAILIDYNQFNYSMIRNLFTDAIYSVKPQFIDNQMCLLRFFVLGDKRGTKISAQSAKKTLIQFHF